MTIRDTEHANSLNNGASCSPQEQKRIVKELNDQAESNLKEGNLYYVISAKWFIGWQRYTEQGDVGSVMNGSSPDLSNGVDRPGPIDNSELVSSVNESHVGKIELIRTLEEGQDYVLVPEEVWKKLLEWYNGGPPLPRKLISEGAINKKINVEVYPLTLKLTDCRDNSESDISLSKKASILELYEKVCTLKGLPQDKIHIWDFFNDKKRCILVPSNKTLEDADLQMDQHILLEVKVVGEASSGPEVTSAGNELALVPMEPSRSAVTIAGGPTFSNGYATRYRSNMYSGLSSSSTVENGGHDSVGSQRKKEKGGLAGLQNLGNTCFMNSALQCLVNQSQEEKRFGSPLVTYLQGEEEAASTPTHPSRLALFLVQNPNPKPKPKRWKLALEIRLRLDFSVIQLGPQKPVYPSLLRSRLVSCIESMFGGEKVKITESDIELEGPPAYVRLSSSEPEPDSKCRAIANGRAYLRDLRFVPQLAKLKQLPVYKIRELVRRTFSAMKLRIVGSGVYQFPATLPKYEVASELMYLVAKPFAGPLVPLQHPLTLVIKGLPFSWFTDAYSDSDSHSNSDPTPSLFSFFQRLASPHPTTIRILDISESDDASNVVVQFESYGDCYKVLKRMCSSSLLKVDYDGSKTRADYEIMWKDFM